jgi:hypothetical protein
MAERIKSVELEPDLVKAYADTFISRWDMYPFQRRDNGSYVTVKKPLKSGMVYSHLTCHWKETKPFTIGAYALSPDSEAKWLCLDADDDQEWQHIWKLAIDLNKQDVPTYVEQSRRGGHLWFFFHSPIPGHEARDFGKYLIQSGDLPSSIEIYPKQDQLADGPGSLVRLPLGIHQKAGKVFHFVGLDGKPLAPRVAQQIELLSQPDRVPQPFVEDVLLRVQEIQQLDELCNLEVAPTNTALQPRETLSEAIKRSITVGELVSRYIELDQQGRGLCPLHDDNVKSFQVNTAKNYWSCYAGCGGGSVVDFMMKLRERNGEDGSFTATVLAMREMFLN